jgi:predicted NUDIX family phosphoesterase
MSFMRGDKKKSGIMVVDREVLLGGRYFREFSPAGEYDYESIILGNYRFTDRREAEEDPFLKQPVGYCVVVNPKRGTILTYRRAEEEASYEEGRLRGRWSVGIGGHVEPPDSDEPNPIEASMMREIREELAWNGRLELQLLGYINDDVDMVGKVHFGLLYLLKTRASMIKPRSKEIAEAGMVAIADLGEMMREGSRIFEGWSRIAYGPVIRLMRTGDLFPKDAPTL